MPDIDRLDQCVMLAQTLWFLPGPARARVADGLFSLGVRVHPELATQKIEYGGAAGLGSHRPRSLVDVKTRRDDMMRAVAPDLYDKLQVATTEQQKQALLAEIRLRAPAWIAQVERMAQEQS